MALEYFRNYELQAEDQARLLEDLRYRLEYLRLREEVAIYQTFFLWEFYLIEKMIEIMLTEEKCQQLKIDLSKKRRKIVNFALL